MDGATIDKIRNLRDVAAGLRGRVSQMSREDYIAHMVKGAEELEMMANSLEIEGDSSRAVQSCGA